MSYLTVKQKLNEASPRAYVVREALSGLIRHGFGDCLVVTFYGNPDAKGKKSGRYKTGERLRAEGYVVRGIGIGPQLPNGAGGKLVFVAFEKSTAL